MKAPYEIQVEGYLDLDWTEWFPGFDLTHMPDGSTVLRGTVDDQPALHGLLAKIDKLGLPIHRIEQLTNSKLTNSEDQEQDHEPNE